MVARRMKKETYLIYFLFLFHIWRRFNCWSIKKIKYSKKRPLMRLSIWVENIHELIDSSIVNSLCWFSYLLSYKVNSDIVVPSTNSKPRPSQWLKPAWRVWNFQTRQNRSNNWKRTHCTKVCTSERFVICWASDQEIIYFNKACRSSGTLLGFWS